MRCFIALLFFCWLALGAMSALIFREPIERQLVADARAALDGRGLVDVRAEFEFLDATLSGNVASSADKLAAAEIVDALDGARVVNNHITFGRDLAPRLEFAGRDPVLVTGMVDASENVPRPGDGFDTSGVRVGGCARPPWGSGLDQLARIWSEEASGGRIELEGRFLKIGGQVPNQLVAWHLLDLAESAGANLDVVSELELAEQVPFSISVDARGSEVALRGVVRDERLRLAFGSLADGLDTGGLEINPAAADGPWLLDVPDAVRRTFELAIDVSLAVTPDSVRLSASFADQFWLEAAERALRSRIGSAPEMDLDLQLARRAVTSGGAESSPGTGGAGALFPITIDVADDRIRLVGTVRTRDERTAIVEKIAAARPGAEIDNALKYDYSQPRLSSIRPALPDFLAFAVSGISDFGSIDLAGRPWQLAISSHDVDFLIDLGRVGSMLSGCGVPLDLDLRLRDRVDVDSFNDRLAMYPIYFRAGSAQISPLQAEKLEALAGLVVQLGAGRALAVVGTDRDDGRLALQRSRAVRRALVGAGVDQGRLAIRGGSASRPQTWRSDRVHLELAGDGDQN